MKIILTKQCESLTGSLGRGFGYHIEHRKNGFFSKRDQRGTVPRDGHWRFIVACAMLAQMKLHIEDIQVPAYELAAALQEATRFYAAIYVKHIGVYNAAEIIQFVERLGL